jgi:hypothetical protein
MISVYMAIVFQRFKTFIIDTNFDRLAKWPNLLDWRYGPMVSLASFANPTLLLAILALCRQNEVLSYAY